MLRKVIMAIATQRDFDKLLVDDASQLGGRLKYNRMSRNAVTFKAGLDAPIHRWFRLTPSFGPDLVRQILSEVEAQRGELVLDPFSGAATTLIEAQLLGYEALGFEINPFLHFVGETSLNWQLDTHAVTTTLNQVEKKFRRVQPSVSFDNLVANGLTIPTIHNPTRWWRKDVLVALLVLKQAIRDCKCDDAVRACLTLGLAGALVPDLTNVTLGRLQLHFIDRSEEQIDVLASFTRKMREMIQDIEQVRGLGQRPRANLFLQDATKLNGFCPPKPVSVVITSPPYPNRYSYVWNTRPHLYFFDFFSVPKEASDLDVRTIGGTWGTATSMLAKGTIPPIHPAVESVAGSVIEEIRKRDNLMANYVMRYFNLLAEQICSLVPILSDNARLAYVVGCSTIKDVYVETDVLLGRLLEELGLGIRLMKIERIRKRNSGKDLHESIVYAHKP